jgi:hypothetical protein
MTFQPWIFDPVDSGLDVFVPHTLNPMLDIPPDDTALPPPTDPAPLKRSRAQSLGESDQDDLTTKRTKTLADPALGMRGLKVEFPDLHQVVIWAKAYYRSYCMTKSPYLHRGSKIDLAGDVHTAALALDKFKNFQAQDNHPQHDLILNLVSHQYVINFLFS